MIRPDTLTIVDKGSGYLIGEVTDDRHPQFRFLEQGCLVTLFDGVDNALDYIKTKMPVAKQTKSSSDKGRGGSFHHFGNYEEAMETFTNKPESVVKFDPSELRIKDDNESGTSVDFDVTGDYIDMGRFMEGVPETFGTMHNGNARNRRINILINLTNSWRIDQAAILHRSERILRLVDALEAGGIRCQLTAIESSECSHVEIILKHHDEPLTVSDLAVVTHPDFFRRMLFRVSEYSKTHESAYGSGIILGRTLTTDLVQAGNISVNEMDIVIDSNLPNKTTVNSLFDKLERLLVWEMSKPVPEVDAVKLDEKGIYFNPNGARSDAEIQREGKEAIANE